MYVTAPWRVTTTARRQSVVREGRGPSLICLCTWGEPGSASGDGALRATLQCCLIAENHEAMRVSRRT